MKIDIEFVPQWVFNFKDLPHLFTGRASSHEEKIEQYKSVLKELKKLNRKK